MTTARRLTTFNDDIDDRLVLTFDDIDDPRHSPFMEDDFDHHLLATTFYDGINPLATFNNGVNDLNISFGLEGGSFTEYSDLVQLPELEDLGQQGDIMSDPLDTYHHADIQEPVPEAPGVQTSVPSDLALVLPEPPSTTAADSVPIIINAPRMVTPSIASVSSNEEEEEEEQEAARPVTAPTGDGNIIMIISKRAGGPLRDHRDQQRYRDIVRKHSRAYKNAKGAHKTRIKNRVFKLLREMGFRFFKEVQVEENEHELTEMTEEEILEKIRRRMIDDKRYDKIWYWVDENTGEHLFMFGNKAATRLEEMYRKDAKDRTIVEVTIKKEQRLVDLNKWEMRKRNDINHVVEVGRKTSSQEADSKKSITVPDSDMEQDDNDAAGEEPSSSTGYSDNGDQTSVASLTGDSTSGASTPFNHNSLGLVGEACHEFFFVIDGIDFTIREATQEEIYDAISIDLEESYNEEMTSDGVTTMSPSSLAVGTDGESLDKLPVVHLSSSKPTSTFKKKIASKEEEEEEEENPTEVVESYQPGVVRVDNNMSKTIHEVIWVWRESRTRMASHDATVVYGDAKNCWIRYDATTTKELEQAYQLSGHSGCYKMKEKYQVDFATMRQTNALSGYQREVKRIDIEEHTSIMPRLMMKTPDSMKKSPPRSIEVKASGVDTTLAKKMATVQLHEYNDKTAESFISSTANNDLGTAK